MGDPFFGLSDDPSVLVSYAGAFPSDGETTLADPMGVAIGGRRVFVAESGAGRIAVFSTTGKHLSSIVLPVKEGAMRAVPTALVALGPRRVAVIDAAAGEVLVARAVGKSGTILFRVGAADPDTAPRRPTALAYGAGTLYVADAASGTIKCYDRRGRFRREIKGASQVPLGFIGGMAYTGGSLIVTESDSGRVVRVDVATGAVAGFCADARALPRGVVAMTGGAVAVSDVLGGAVTVCDDEGRVVRTVDRTTVAQAALSSPEGVAWRGRTGRLYVTDPDQGKVVVVNVRE